MHRIKLKHLLLLSCILGLVLIVFHLVPMNTCRLLTFVLRKLLSGILYTGFLLLTLVSFIYLFVRISETRLVMLPFIINITLLLSVLFGPSRELVRNWGFQSRLDEYNQVVGLVQSGDIGPESVYKSRVLLPPEYRHLSNCGGEILVDTDDDIVRVFFFTDYQPGWNSFGGYLYSADGKPAQPDDFSLGDWGCEEQQQKSWFYCIHYD